MAVTIAMIEEKAFKRKLNGFDPDEVDEFLDEICDTMEAMQKEIVSLQQRLKQQQQQQFRPTYTAVPIPPPVSAAPGIPAPVTRSSAIPSPVTPAAAPVQTVTPVSAPLVPAEIKTFPEEKKPEAPEKTPESDASAATALMLRAQRVYDETVADAEKKAKEIVESARTETEERIRRLEEDKKQALEEVELVRSAAKDYRERFLRLIEDQKHILNTETELFDE